MTDWVVCLNKLLDFLVQPYHHQVQQIELLIVVLLSTNLAKQGGTRIFISTGVVSQTYLFIVYLLNRHPTFLKTNTAEPDTPPPGGK